MTGQDHDSSNLLGERFPASSRLKRPADFEAVFAGNRFAADETLVITAVGNGSPVTRLGLSIGRQVGNAVVRNRWKRLIREAFRRHRRLIPLGLDLVVRPRKGAIPGLEPVERSLLALTQRIDRDLRRGNRPASSAARRSGRAGRGGGK